MKPAIAAVLPGVLFLSSGATAQTPSRSLDCYRSLVRCGTGSPTFQVFVGSDARVERVVPTAPDASPEVAQAARCLAEHPDELDQLIARSKLAPPFQFEFGGGWVFCDHSLFEPDE